MEDKDKKFIIRIGKPEKSKGRPFKITLTRGKDGDKIELEGSDPFTTALLFGGLQVVKEGAKRLINKIDEISKKVSPPQKT